MNFLALKSYFNIGSLTIYWYAICILVGVAIGVYLALREVKKMGIASDVIYLGVLIILPISIVGARLWYVIFNVDEFSNFWEVLGFYNGQFQGLSGLAIQGGVIAALISIVIYCKKKEVSLYCILDVVAPAFFIGQICGRWGNFFNQELYGPVVKNYAFLKAIPILGDQMYINGAYRHPVFLYEGLLNSVGLALMFVGRRIDKKMESGDLMGFYLIWYGCVRIPMEVLRLNSGVSDPILFPGTKIPVSIVTAVIFIIAGIAFLILKRNVLTKFMPRRGYIEVIEYATEHHVDTLIFDLDGTLLNTRALIDASFIHTFEKYRPDHNLTDEELDSFFGPTLKESFSKYSTDPAEIDSMIEYYREYNLANHDDYVKPFPGCKDMLKTLSKKGYKIAVVSSKKKELVEHGLEFCGIKDYINLVIGSEEVTNPKPDPEGINKALVELNMAAMKNENEKARDDSEYKKHALYIGDTKSDILAAKNAGIRSCGVLYIKHPEIMLEVTPDFVINKLSDIIGICGE